MCVKAYSNIIFSVQQSLQQSLVCLTFAWRRHHAKTACKGPHKQTQDHHTLSLQRLHQFGSVTSACKGFELSYSLQRPSMHVASVQAKLALKDVLDEQDSDHENMDGSDENLPADLLGIIGGKHKKESKDEKSKRKEQEKIEREEAKKKDKEAKQQEMLNKFNEKIDAMSAAEPSKAKKASSNLHSILTKQSHNLKQLRLWA